MKPEEIYLKRQEYLLAIKEAEQGLIDLQSQCPHTEKEETLWSWRIGCFDKAYICKHCGKFLTYIYR